MYWMYSGLSPHFLRPATSKSGIPNKKRLKSFFPSSMFNIDKKNLEYYIIIGKPET